MIYYFIFITNIVFFVLGGYVGYRVHEWQHREIKGESKPMARPKAKADKKSADRLRREIKNMLTYDGTDQTNRDV